MAPRSAEARAASTIKVIIPGLKKKNSSSTSAGVRSPSIPPRPPA